MIAWVGGTGTGSGTGIGAGGGWNWVCLSWVTRSDWIVDDFGGTTGGCGSDCSQAFLASCSALLPSGSNSSRMVWSTWTLGTEDANGGVSTGRGGGPSDPGGVSVLAPLEVVVGGFAATMGSSGSLSSIGRDQGSIGSEREREPRVVGRSGLGVEEDEAMSGGLLLRRRGSSPLQVCGSGTRSTFYSAIAVASTVSPRPVNIRLAAPRTP